jgi:hypothetical protein
MNFEEYIKNQKEDLHTETPSFTVWNNIQKEFLPKKKNYTAWAIAASLLLLMGISIFYFLQPKKDATAIAKTKDVNTTPLYTDIDTLKPITTAPTTVETKQAVSKPTIITTTTLPTKITPNIASSIKPSTPKLNRFMGQNFYDSTILALKQKIEATPVKWVDQNYFTVYLTEYKNLEREEMDWKKKIGQDVSETDFIIRLIQINQQKIDLLANLLKQIKNINTKKGDTTQTNYNKIII